MVRLGRSGLDPPGTIGPCEPVDQLRIGLSQTGRPPCGQSQKRSPSIEPERNNPDLLLARIGSGRGSSADYSAAASSAAVAQIWSAPARARSPAWEGGQ